MYGGLHSSFPDAGPLVEVARGFTPRVERSGPATLLLDLHGLGRTWHDPEALGRALLEAARARDPGAHVALAGTRTAALVLARARDGLTLVPLGGEAAALAPLPLAALGLVEERLELLQRWGLHTLGELAALPAAGLAERFGGDGPRLRRMARGEDDRPFVPTAPPESFECALELDWPVDGLEPLAFLLGRVLQPLCDGLAARGRRAAAMSLELRLVDGTAVLRRLAPAAPSADPRTWRTLLLLDVEAHPPADAVAALAVRAEPTPSRVVQFSLLDPAQPSPEKLAEALGRLHEWTAAGRAGSPALVDSHRPGAFAMTSFVPGRPEGLPLAVTPRVALRAFRPPLPAQVALQGGAPAFVAAPGVRGAVGGSAGPWRASGDWWDEAWSREEWDVTIDGRLYRIFRDRLRDAWFVEGELD
jgi:protein ImuB